MANPAALAEAALSLLEHPDQWQAAQEAGIRRVQSLYTQTDMIEAYRKIYTGALEVWQESALSSARS